MATAIKIKVHLRELTSAVETLTLAVNQRDVTDKVEDISNILGFEFQLNEIASMKELENLLSIGDEKTRLVLLLGRVGGDVVSSMTYRVIAKLMTNRLRTEITWTGRSKPNELKHKMVDMPRIVASICDAVRFHPRLKEATDYEMYTSVKEWLGHSIDRYKKSNLIRDRLIMSDVVIALQAYYRGVRLIFCYWTE